MLHDVAAGGAAHHPRAGGGRRCYGRHTCVRRGRWDWRVGGGRGELSAQCSEMLTKGRTEKAIVTYLDETFGQDVLQETLDELVGGQRAEFGLARVGLVTERDLVVLDLDDTPVAEGDAKDVRGKILERGAAIADRFAMNDPVLLPHRGGDVRKAIRLAQGVTELGAKEFRERLDRQQELFSRRVPRCVIVGQAARGDEIMHVGMVRQVACPGVQDADQAECAADETRIMRQLLRGFRRSAKEGRVHKFLVTACEGAELAGQGEGEHKVGHR